jgi:CheY-like chemotaxis protein
VPGTTLLVEDSHADVLLIRRAVAKTGADVKLKVVSDGDAAVDYLEGDGIYADRDQYPLPDVVLLDLKLPRRSGFEVLEWLRRQPRLKRLPVAVLTSSRHTTDIDRAYDLGANSYLVKPVEFQALVDLMKAVDLYWSVLNEPPSLLAP